MAEGILQLYYLEKRNDKIYFPFEEGTKRTTLTSVRNIAGGIGPYRVILFSPLILSRRHYFFGHAISQKERQEFHSITAGLYSWQLDDDPDRASNEIIVKIIVPTVDNLQMPGPP